MSERIAKEEWVGFGSYFRWFISKRHFADAEIYQRYVVGWVKPICDYADTQPAFESKNFAYDGDKPEDMARALNEAKVWAEEWVEENIFKLGRERFQAMAKEELEKAYPKEIMHHPI